MSGHVAYKVAWIGCLGLILGPVLAAVVSPLATRIVSELPTNKAASEPAPIPTNLKVVSTIRWLQVP